MTSFLSQRPICMKFGDNTWINVVNSSSILWEKIAIFFWNGHSYLSQKPTLCDVSVGVFLSAYWQTCTFLSQNECPFNLILQGPKICLCRWRFVYDLLFWRYFTLKVPKIYSARLCLQFRTMAHAANWWWRIQLLSDTHYLWASSHVQRNMQRQIHRQCIHEWICGMTVDPIFAAGFCMHFGRH